MHDFLPGTQLVPDVFDPTSLGRPGVREVWADLRRNRPVFWNPEATGGGVWVITRYQDVRTVCQDHQAFTSEGGIRIDSDPVAVAAARGVDLLVTDPPHHTVLRKAFSAHLGARSVEALAEQTRDAARELIRTAIDQPECDFIEAVSRPLANRLIGTLMGVPDGDRARLAETIELALASVGPERVGAAQAELYVYSYDLVQATVDATANHMLARVVQGFSDALTSEELVMNVHGLFLAATETVRHAAAGGLLALIERPDQWRRLKGCRQLLPSAVEEMLRWTSPGMHVMRTATREVSLGGQCIRAGDRVVAWIPSANDDERIFARPLEFDVARRPNRHLAFGVGQHFCIGSHVARLELRSVFEELLAQVRHVELAGPPRRLRSNRIQGLEQLRVRLHR